MGVRKAVPEDCLAIKILLEELGYPNTEIFLPDKMKLILSSPFSDLFVYEMDNTVVAFISLDYIPQLAVAGDFMRITYFAVLQKFQSEGIGNELEKLCTKIARQRNCDRIEVHCNERRTDAHRFYFKHGYVESPKYLIKKLS